MGDVIQQGVDSYMKTILERSLVIDVKDIRQSCTNRDLEQHCNHPFEIITNYYNEPNWIRFTNREDYNLIRLLYL